MKEMKTVSSFSYLVNILRKPLILLKKRSTILRCLYNSLSYFQGFLRFDFGGTTG